ncbi:hypothetical protein Q4433_05555 [Streptococcus parasanguinis]|uniref:Antitoxin n=1 Tax=Streptococcus gingivalis TaxID=3111861 RepID=A0ABU6B605_9STRE|nr:MULTISPECIES: hypothetical protein [Streptococcus]MDO6230307.1 hypothetical protein [Streptococcus parasanguinis]MEB3519156.1 hypothetical protein [Streptococcus sp. S2(2023)]MTS08920.1 hypothetical protein [Streptococcus parasanguinis]
MKRNYIVKVNNNSQKFLLVEFDSSSCQSLSNFLNSEVHNFYPHIYKELEAVVTGQKEASYFDGNLLGIEIGKEITEVYFQFEEEILGEPYFISTDELYKLVIEWKEMEDKMYRGEDIFPVTIED